MEKHYIVHMIHGGDRAFRKKDAHVFTKDGFICFKDNDRLETLAMIPIHNIAWIELSVLEMSDQENEG